MKIVRILCGRNGRARGKINSLAVIRCMLMGGLALSQAGHAQGIATTDTVYAAMAAPDMAWALAPGSSPPEPVSGPPRPESPLPAKSDERAISFGSRLGAAKWEVAGIFAYITVSQIAVTKGTESFHFQDEGWFGKSTKNLGVDKLTHAYNSYLLTEFLQARIKRKTDDSIGAPLTAALLAAGLMAYSELYDAHKESSGWSNQDVISNLAGAGFSVLRNSIPGMKDKIDFRLLLMPNSDLYTFKGKKHYAQQRFLLALQLSGFDAFRETPLRFLEIHGGYYGKGFTADDHAQGKLPQRKLFFGLGLNLNELFFKAPRSKIGRAAGVVLDYIQIPYTAVHVN